MIEMLFHAHSGLRYLVLLAAVVALVMQAMGAFGDRPYERPSRLSMSAFTGLLDLQMLLGLAMLVLGCFYGALIGHLMMMVLAIAAAHGSSSFARKQADARKAHRISLAGVVVALVLITGGIMSIGRTPITSSGQPTCTAAHR